MVPPIGYERERYVVDPVLLLRGVGYRDTGIYVVWRDCNSHRSAGNGRKRVGGKCGAYTVRIGRRNVRRREYARFRGGTQRDHGKRQPSVVEFEPALVTK